MQHQYANTHGDNTPGSMESIKILVLDDSDFDLMRIRRFVEASGFSTVVQTAKSIREFRTLLDNSEFDAIFVDYNLTDGNGDDAVRYAKQHPKHVETPVVMISGELSEEKLQSVVAEGCDQFLQKDQLSARKLHETILGLISDNDPDAQDPRPESVAKTHMVLRTVHDICFSEMRPLMARMLRLSRAIQMNQNISEERRAINLHDLERDCIRLYEFLDDLDDIVESGKGVLN